MSNKSRGRRSTHFGAEFREQLGRKLGILSNDSDGRLKSVIAAAEETPQIRAVPLTVTTRGVGFTTAMFYSRACSTWNLQTIAEIATIFQIYRVHLWLTYYKVHCAQQLQSESVTMEGALIRIVISDGNRVILKSISEVPTVFNMVVSNVGKIETDNAIYHMGFAQMPDSDPNKIKYQALVQTPKNIRSTLDRLASDDTPLESRTQFMNLNPIPGARFVNNLLTNADEIWPSNYDTSDLRSDVNAYKNLINRVQTRLPRHTFSEMDMSGKAETGGLWSSLPSEGKIESDFGNVAAYTPARFRAADGSIVAPQEIPASVRFKGASVSGIICTPWYSREKTDLPSMVTGIGSMVGEECFVPTRHELGCPYLIVKSSCTIQYAINDAAR